MSRTGTRVSAIIIKDNEILLIHRRKNGEEYWVFPGGGVEKGESWENAMRREVLEETGLPAISIKFAFMSLNDLDNKEHPFYHCQIAVGEPYLAGEERDRHSESDWYKLEWIDIKNLPDLKLLPNKARQQVIEHY